MGGVDGVDGSQTFPKRTRKESMLGPVGRIIPPLRKQSTIMESLPKLDVQVRLRISINHFNRIFIHLLYDFYTFN